MGNLAKYGDWKVEDAEKEKEESERSGGSANFLKLGVGRTKLRFLPPAIGRNSPFAVAQEHYIELPGATNVVKFACPRLSIKPGRFCPACAKADELRNTGNPADYDLAGKIIAKRRIYANVVNRAEPERGVVIFGFGKTVHEQLLALRSDEDAGGNFVDPSEDGFDIIVEKSGQGLKTEYKVWPDRKRSALGNEEWLDMMHNLDRFVTPPSEEELRKMLGGEFSGGGGGGGLGRPAMTGRSRPSSSASTSSRARGRSAADDVIDTDGEDA